MKTNMMNATMEESMMNGTVSATMEESMMNGMNDGLYDLVNVMPHCPVLLVLDTSHSMWGRGMQDLKMALQDFFATVDSAELPDSMIDIAGVSMGDNLGMLEEFRPFGESGLRSLSIRPKGNTPIGAALELALFKLDEKTADYSQNGFNVLTPHLVILSDGISSDDFEGQAEEIGGRVKHGSLVCRAVALGGNPDLESLRRISGNEVLIPSQGNLRQAFAEVGKMVSKTCEDAVDEIEAEISDVPPEAKSEEPVTGPEDSAGRPGMYLLDGSNIIYWGKPGKETSLKPVLAIADELKRRGESFLVIFDASARHLFKSNVAEGEQYEKLLAEDPDHFQQVTAGTRADDFLLLVASQDDSVKIMTQDRFRDYADRYPQVIHSDRLLPGMVIGDMIYFPGINLKIPFSGAGNNQ